jgi:hypothetical protein
MPLQLQFVHRTLGRNQTSCPAINDTRQHKVLYAVRDRNSRWGLHHVAVVGGYKLDRESSHRRQFPHGYEPPTSLRCTVADHDPAIILVGDKVHTSGPTSLRRNLVAFLDD